ncbi:MAG: hypothetical protein LWY06_15550 [Firmicutes bacterium]|nr:hypothetical protein [Bacillota bacterium]
MKKRKLFIVAGLSLFLLTLVVTPVILASSAFPLMDSFMKADFNKKKQALEYLRTNYPNLRQEVFEYITATDPQAPAKFHAAKMELIKNKYPGMPVKLAREILTELEKTHSSPVLDIAVDVSELISTKYPTLPSDIIEWRAESGVRSKSLRVMREKHNGLMIDVKDVIHSGNYKQQVESFGNDVKQLMDSKYPELKENVRNEVMALVKTKYPELPEKIAEIRENPSKNPRFEIPRMISKEYPGLVHEVLTTVRDKYGKEIHSAAMDILKIADEKYPTLSTDLMADISAMIAQKHPELITDMAKVRFACHREISEKVKQKYPGFGKDLKAMMESKYPGLGKQVFAVIHKTYPNLRKDMAEMMTTRFSGLITGLHEDIAKKHPKLIPELTKILQ